ncbi:fumarylacetoacetate hydrolase family protein [Streptomyces sp. GbtcB6]|uniref:fumarylacetoacetate hydrolase family protein n=1 Tax=Streptomyces sp. GbtcB6 TaxID=2824751 RepID=UPI001C2FCBF6|nr:fumarylacetoacetate hydrolase family protein [Streptomyces sp. GbtcB6]
MRIANHDSRLTLVDGEKGLDVEELSEGRFPADVHGAYERWDELRAWAASWHDGPEGFPLDPTLLGPPSPRPAQVFAVGLNYADHVAEGGYSRPEAPTVFTKFPTSLTGPYGEIALPPGTVDWEVEVVVVIGLRTAGPVEPADAWSHVAGLTVGQDLSERVTQHRPPAPQFSLGKSFPGFGPLGPVLVTPDEFADPDDLALSCRLNGRTMQSSRTSRMIFDVPALLSYLSGVVTLLPGDVVFTGTPDGVGRARKPPLFLRPGDVLESEIEGIGSLRHTFVTAPAQ